MMQRFQFERLKFHEKNAAFNLEDDTETLTHGGEALGDSFADFSGSDNEDEFLKRNDGELDQLNFGGFEKKEGTVDFGSDEEGDADRPKTRKEIFEEVIAKSKHFRRERAQTKQELEDLTAEVDGDLDGIMGLLAQGSDKSEKAADALPRDKLPDYDKEFRKLTYEAKGRATDRLKTPEERAQDELVRLQKLEDERLERMEPKRAKAAKAAALSNSAEYLGGEVKKPKRVVLTHGEDGVSKLHEEGTEDPLEQEDEYDWDGKNMAEAEGDSDDDEDADEEEEDSDDDDEDGAAAAAAWEAKADAGEESADADTEEAPEDDEADAEAMADAEAASRELRYTYAMPDSEGGIVELLKGHTVEDKMTILGRIVVCHNVKLKAENRALMNQFFDDLLAFMCTVADTQHEDAFALVNALVVPLFQVAQQVTEHAADTVVRDVARIAEEVRADNGILAFSDACVLRLVSTIFPASDFRHRVVTPAFLVLGQVLSDPIADPEDTVAALVASGIAFDFCAPNKRYLPEVMGFLCGLLAAFRGEADTGEYHFQFAGTAEALKWAADGKAADKKLKPGQLHFGWISGCPAPITQQWRLDVATNALQQLTRYAGLYGELPAFNAVFAPARRHAEALQTECKNSSVGASCKALLAACEQMGGVLEPLTLQKHKPVPLTFLEPDVQEGGYFGRKNDTDPDKDRKELRKLKRLHKQEMRGAVRELRKDAKFVANVKQQEKADFDKGRDAVVRGYENEMAQDHGQAKKDEKARQRLKGKLK